MPIHPWLTDRPFDNLVLFPPGLLGKPKSEFGFGPGHTLLTKEPTPPTSDKASTTPKENPVNTPKASNQKSEAKKSSAKPNAASTPDTSKGAIKKKSASTSKAFEAERTLVRCRICDHEIAESFYLNHFRLYHEAYLHQLPDL